MIKADHPEQAENMVHWLRLCTTDPAYTKAYTRPGGFSGTDISPAYRIQRLTEEFGPCGKGWGHTVHRTWRESFPGKNGPQECVFAEVSIWWTGNGERYETGSQIGGTLADRTPDEAYKMAITDGLSKCMLFLGMSADVYLGHFDDSKYGRPKPPPQQKRPPQQQQQPRPSNGQPTSDELDQARDYSERFASVWSKESLKMLGDELRNKLASGDITAWVKSKAVESGELAKARVEIASKANWRNEEIDNMLRDLANVKKLDDFDEWLSVRRPGMEEALFEKFINQRNRVADKLK